MLTQKVSGTVYKFMKTPVGLLKLIASDKGLVAVLWENDDPSRVKDESLSESRENPFIIETERQLSEYFTGKRRDFTLKLDMRGTDFQKTVWRALQEIPFGKTQSYGELAKRIKNPKACRAVGGANGRNPISIIVPCHRVIGANGSLTGFAGGIEIKEKLLKLEQFAL